MNHPTKLTGPDFTVVLLRMSEFSAFYRIRDDRTKFLASVGLAPISKQSYKDGCGNGLQLQEEFGLKQCHKK